MARPVPQSVARVLSVFGEEDHGRLLAALVNRFRDFDLAEEALQEAVLRAVETWPRRGVPDRPQAWLMATARNCAIDLIRADEVRIRHLSRLHIEDGLRRGDHEDHAIGLAEAMDLADIPDERLGLFFTCAHPTLREDERIVLILRFLSGLTTAEIAAAFLVETTTMQQRIVRAKKRITTTGIPFGRPEPARIVERLPGVLRVVYLIFTQGFTATAGDVHTRVDLQEEAMRLARLLSQFLPEETEVRGLLALLLLTHARARARVSADGTPVPLAEQDRALWDSGLIAEGLDYVRGAAGETGSGTYTIQAAIAALHAEAPSFDETDWPQILVLYRLLSDVDQSPVVALNTAIALGQAAGPEPALKALNELADEPQLLRHRPFHIARAITLSDLGRAAEAESAYARALECPGNEAESEYIIARVADLDR
ncbi:RNA polymerase sigma factor [Brevibacterium renqingii]|jgi:RNA polymerase sigma-70 factor (ECF subfamily)|uniref:RNA polymerase sigma factor n=1 Tax=Brevibacterium renqingii TaxID=2776916 RepID=UPI001AE0C06A|nr:sigma-70 family RNA polymerase sigma factor [Brevibacterium renqingii]